MARKNVSDEKPDEELRILWGNSDDPIVKMVLSMCYLGFRLSAYEKIEVFYGRSENRSRKGTYCSDSQRYI